MNSNVYQNLLEICEQLLIYSALPSDMLQKYQAVKKKKLEMQSSSSQLQSTDATLFCVKLIKNINLAVSSVIQYNDQNNLTLQSGEKYINDSLQLTQRLIDDNKFMFQFEETQFKEEIMQLFKSFLTLNRILRDTYMTNDQNKENIQFFQTEIKKLKLELSICASKKEQDQQITSIELFEKNKKLQDQIESLNEELRKYQKTADFSKDRSEDEIQRLQRQHSQNVQYMERNFDQLIKEARLKIDKLEQELEENNIFLSRFAESLLPYLEIYESDFINFQGNLVRQKSEKDILLDFLLFMMEKHVGKNNLGTKKQYAQLNDQIRNDIPLPTTMDYPIKKTPLPNESKEIQSPYFKETKNIDMSSKQSVDLEDLYKQLKSELEQSRSTLKEFERSRSNLQSALNQ